MGVNLGVRIAPKRRAGRICGKPRDIGPMLCLVAGMDKFVQRAGRGDTLARQFLLPRQFLGLKPVVFRSKRGLRFGLDIGRVQLRDLQTGSSHSGLGLSYCQIKGFGINLKQQVAFGDNLQLLNMDRNDTPPDR